MRKFKTFYYIIYFGYIGTSVYFGLYTETMFKQFGMFSFLKFLQYWAAAGMLLLIFEWILENIHLFQLRRRNKRLEKEVMSLKSELYEIQKDKIASGTTPEALPPETVQLAPPDKDSSATSGNSSESSKFAD